MSHYRAKLSSSFGYGGMDKVGVNDGDYQIYADGRLVMPDRTFSRDLAIDICDALETARRTGAEQGCEA